MHRDIKASRILLDENDNAKLSNFEYATHTRDQARPTKEKFVHLPIILISSSSSSSTFIHLMNTSPLYSCIISNYRFVGTLAYIDPEYVRSQQYTLASDVFSFGVLLLQLWTGSSAFAAGDPIFSMKGVYRYIIS